MSTRKRCIYKVPPEMGFFAFYNISLVLVDYCLKYGYAPSLNLDNFIYQNPSSSINPWDVFFEPLGLFDNSREIKEEIELLFSRRPPLICTSDPSYSPLFCIWNRFPDDLETRLKLNEFCKHIKIKQEFMDQAEEFIKEHFSGKKVTGIHIRHTDHWVDSIPYAKNGQDFHPIELYVEALRKDTSDLIYVATDTKRNIDYLRLMKDLRKKLIYNDFLRAPGEEGSHIGRNEYSFDPVRLGKEILVETLILSRCDHLIGSYSNITLTALFWNPYLPFTNIAQMVK